VASKTKSEDLRGLGSRLAKARIDRGLSQAQLAERAHLKRQQITFFEQGQRLPGLDQLLRLAAALEIPVQTFLTGTDRPPTDLKALAIELRRLGLVDLWVEGPLVPGAFRRPEEVVALALAGDEPAARIVEAMPAVLAWNRWSGALLRAYGSLTRPHSVYRLAWLAEVALALDRTAGFPGGCPGRQDLAAFVKRVKAPRSSHWDDLGRAAGAAPTSPVWKRWRINYAADLTTFRERAETLLALRKAEAHRPPTTGEVADGAE
jgi:transcriptional regulator with XRE-family HTH domain